MYDANWSTRPELWALRNQGAEISANMVLDIEVLGFKQSGPAEVLSVSNKSSHVRYTWVTYSNEVKGPLFLLERAGTRAELDFWVGINKLSYISWSTGQSLGGNLIALERGFESYFFSHAIEYYLNHKWCITLSMIFLNWVIVNFLKYC